MVPEFRAVLPPTAISKYYPYLGDCFGLTASRTGMFVSPGGYVGLTIGWIEGIELNFMGGVLGLDIRRPALRLPRSADWDFLSLSDTAFVKDPPCSGMMLETFEQLASLTLANDSNAAPTVKVDPAL
jgi:hypothetical protein